MFQRIRRLMRDGQRLFRRVFGLTVDVGYSVDNGFGHRAMLPSLLGEHGFDSHVIMRPMAHEKTLPRARFAGNRRMGRRSPRGASRSCNRSRADDLPEQIGAVLPNG